MRLLSSTLILAALTGGLLCAQRRALPEEELQRLLEEQAARVDTSKEFVETNQPRFGLDASYVLQPTDNPVLDEFGTLHVSFVQRFRGVPVRNGRLITHLSADGTMLEPSDRLYRGIDIKTEPTLNSAQALEAVRVDLGTANRAFSNMPAEALTGTIELQIDPILETTTPPADAAAGAAVNAKDEAVSVTGFRLIYRVLATPAEDGPDEYDFAPAYYFIDAETGRVLRKREAQSNADPGEPAEGVGYPIYRKKVPVWATKVNGEYQLYDLTRGDAPGNATRSNNNKESHKWKHTSTISDGSNGWGDNQQYGPSMPLGGQTAQSPAIDIFWATARTWDVLANVFKRQGLDGKGTPISTRAHYGVNYTDAHYSYGPQAAYFGDGVLDPDPEVNVRPNIGLPTVAHELGHGVWGHHMTTDYDQKSEAAGLNEGHGDILGAITNFYTNVSQGKGTSLTYASDNNYFHYRSYTPSSYPSNPEDPPFYNQTGRRYWQPGMGSFEEHVQGCAYGHMFVMLVEGASRDTKASTYSTYFPSGMAGIGLSKAARVWYLASTAFPPSHEPTFASMRDAWVEAAEYAYGPGSAEANAVMNAWAAINVGKAVKDTAQPQVSALVLQLNESEGSLVATATASDDTVPMVEFGLGGSVRSVRMMPPYQAVIDVSKLKPGTYTAFARAVDYAGKSVIQYAQFTIKGTHQALTNGSFEDGSTDWAVSSGDMVWNGTAAFLGGNYLRFRDDAQTASHKFKVPKEALSATLSIRYRVVGVEYLPGENLFVDLYEPGINKTTPIADVSSQEVTLNDPLRHYKRMEFDITDFKNKDMVLRLKSALSQGNVTRFAIDAVSINYKLPESLALVAELDEPAHIVRMRATPAGLDPEAVKSISYRINGQQVAIDALGLDGAVYSNPNVPAGTYSVQAIAFRQDNSQLASNVVPITFTGKKNLVLNGDFESGAAYWTLPGVNSAIGTNSGEAQIYNAQSGTRYANFVTSGGAGTSRVRQLIGIPANPFSVTVSFYLKMAQSAKDAGDVFRAALVSTGNQVLVPIATVDGADSLPDSKAIAGYTRFTLQLNATQLNQVKGKTVYLEFSVDQNNSGVTTFCVDDASVYAPVLGYSN